MADKPENPRQVLAHEIIEAGCKQLSKKYHPDTGGAHEQFLALTKTRDWLRGLVDGRPPTAPTAIPARRSTARQTHHADDMGSMYAEAEEGLNQD